MMIPLIPFTRTLKILNQYPVFWPFSGQDPNYSVLTILTFCEDAMCNSNVVDGSDKITFICSNLESASLALQMMQASAFDPKLI